MSVKRMITFASVAVAGVGFASAVLAGGSNHIPTFSDAGIYVNGNVGALYRPWLDDVTTVVVHMDKKYDEETLANGNNGGILGGDLGYQFNKFFAVETGLYHFCPEKFTVKEKPSESFSIKSNIGYGALKGIIPVSHSTYFFGKLGIAYTHNEADKELDTLMKTKSGELAQSSSSNFWNPLFAFGIQYYFTPNVSAQLAYTYVPGYRGASSCNFATVPDIHLFTAGFGYKFLM